jgi:methionyl-tRNA formyltransferase
MGSKPRILFMGTPDFAVPSLNSLLGAGYPLLGVVTQPDKPRGRGRQMACSPVKALALEKGIDCLQPARVREPSFREAFRALAPDLVVVAAFGQILPREILEEPPRGCINVHPSLLPRYRGAAPINWTLIRGEAVTGVTIMRVDEGVDTGDMLLQTETPVGQNETYDQLHDRLALLGADLLLQAVQSLEAGTVTPRPQDDALATHAPRLTREDGRIDWRGPSEAIARLVRGLSSVPGAYTTVEGRMLKVFMATSRPGPVSDPPGAVGVFSPQGLPVAAGDGLVFLTDVQLEGKKRMSIGEFLRGYRLREGQCLGAS